MKYFKILTIGIFVLAGMFFYQDTKADAKELKANKTYSIDLNGDGKKEKILWKRNTRAHEASGGNGKASIYINGKKKKTVVGYYYGRIFIEDINKRDRYKDVLVQFAAENDRMLSAYAYRYEKSGFKKLFAVGMDEGMSFSFEHQKGDGKVYCAQEYDDPNLQQGGIIGKYKIKSGKLVALKNKTVSLDQYSAKRKYTASKSLSVQMSLKNSRTKFKIKKGEAFYITKFRLNVNLKKVFEGDGKKFSYFYVKTKSGKGGWVKNKYKNFFYENYTAA